MPYIAAAPIVGHRRKSAIAVDPKPRATLFEIASAVYVWRVVPERSRRGAAMVLLALRKLEDADLVGGGQDALLQEAAPQQRVDDRRLACGASLNNVIKVFVLLLGERPSSIWTAKAACEVATMDMTTWKCSTKAVQCVPQS